VGEAILDGVEVFLLRAEGNVSEVLRPIAERAVGVQLGSAYLGQPLGIASEPVEDDQLWVEMSLRHQCLNGSQ